MKRKFLVLVCLVAIVAILATSCDLIGKKGDDTCEHTYSDRWSTNSTEHWHAATCEHATEKSDVASHSDADQDGECDVCGYEIGHEHTYANNWTSNATHHWKAATCSHTEEKGALAVHADSNFDNLCDVCSATLVVELPDNIEEAVILVASRAAAINSGNLRYHFIARNHSDVDPEISKNIDYIFGSDSLHMVSANSAKAPNDLTNDDNTDYIEVTDVMKSWYQLLSADSVFSVTQTTEEGVTGDYELNAGANPALMNGYYCVVSTLLDAYGPENLLVAIYDLSQSSAASDYIEMFDEDTLTYSFAFDYMYVNTETAEGDHVDYYELEVSFTYSRNGMLTGLTVVADCYTNSLANEIDNDYTYDQSNGTITMKDTALADTYTFVFTQTVGERTYVNENPQSKFVPTDYDFFSDADCTTSLNGTINVKTEQAVSIYVGGFAPAGSSILYVVDTVTFTADESLHVWFYGNQIGLNADNAGTYTVEFTVAGVTKSFTVVVESANTSGGNIVTGENEFLVKTTETYDAYMTDLYTFTAVGSGEYTFNIPAGLGLWSVASMNANQFGNPEIDYYDNEEGATVVVELAAGEEYSFYVAAITKGDWIISYTYVYREVSNDNGGDATVIKDANGLGGEYKINWIMDGMFVLTFTPDSAGSRTGTLKVVDNNSSANGGTFSYTIENGAYLIFDSNNMITNAVVISKNGTDWCFQNKSCPNPLTFASETSAGGATSVVAGTYTATAGPATLTVTVDEDTVAFEYNHAMTGSDSATYTYEVVNGAVVLYDEGGIAVNPLAGKLNIDADGVPVSAEYNGNVFTF